MKSSTLALISGLLLPSLASALWNPLQAVSSVLKNDASSSPKNGQPASISAAGRDPITFDDINAGEGLPLEKIINYHGLYFSKSFFLARPYQLRPVSPPSVAFAEDAPGAQYPPYIQVSREIAAGTAFQLREFWLGNGRVIDPNPNKEVRIGYYQGNNRIHVSSLRGSLDPNSGVMVKVADPASFSLPPVTAVTLQVFQNGTPVTFSIDNLVVDWFSPAASVFEKSDQSPHAIHNLKSSARLKPMRVQKSERKPDVIHIRKATTKRQQELRAKAADLLDDLQIINFDDIETRGSFYPLPTYYNGLNFSPFNFLVASYETAEISPDTKASSQPNALISLGDGPPVFGSRDSQDPAKSCFNLHGLSILPLLEGMEFETTLRVVGRFQGEVMQEGSYELSGGERMETLEFYGPWKGMIDEVILYVESGEEGGASDSWKFALDDLIIEWNGQEAESRGAL